MVAVAQASPMDKAQKADSQGNVQGVPGSDEVSDAERHNLIVDSLSNLAAGSSEVICF